MSNKRINPDGQENQRAVLILQGPPSNFARMLGDSLERKNCHVRRINFCTADWIYWHDDRAINYRGSSADWEQFIEDIIKTENITDLVYYADRLPYHSRAAEVARRMGVNDISYEFGYLRPDWVVVERGGQSAYSHFPNDISLIRKFSKGLKSPDLQLKYPYPFIVEAFNEVLFNLVNFFFWFFYPRYDPDKYYTPMFEYLSYIPRLINGAIRERKSNKKLEQLIESNKPYFFVPLQMQNDYQIRKNSPDKKQSDVIEKIISSFSDYCPNDVELIFKMHPLDNGMENWQKIINKCCAKHKLQGRVFFLDGGNFHELCSRARGVVTVNSTSGLHALQMGVPVNVMGIAVYDIPEITHQGSLDGFWTDPRKPKQKDVEALVKLLAHGIHVKGNFYTSSGKKAAIEAFSERIVNDSVNSHSSFVDPPPRMVQARKIGIQIENHDPD